MNAIAVGIVVYLLTGAIALAVLDLMTKRIRSKLATATAEVQLRLFEGGNVVGTKIAAVLLAMALQLFWPFVFIGIFTGKEKSSDGTQR